MNTRLARYFVAGSLTVMLAWPSSGQQTGPSQPPAQPPGSTPSAPTSSQPSRGISNQPSYPNAQTPTFIYGRVIAAGGQPLGAQVSLQLRCGMNSVQMIHPDLEGNFQFVIGSGPQSNMDMSAANDSTAMGTGADPFDSLGRASNYGGPNRHLSGCELQVTVPGYQPLSKSIVDVEDLGRIDAGTLVLTPLTKQQAATVSVTSLLAPKRAQGEFEKGETEARQKHFEAAAKHLEKAVSEYDKYSAAWYDLGEVYSMTHQAEKARDAFAKAIAADGQFALPYVGLATLEMQDGQYEDAFEAAGNALKLYPGMATASFIQAGADLKLNRLEDAEKSARNAENGPHQEIPQLHVLLADLYLRKQDYSKAAAEMRAYLKESPQGPFADEVKKQLGQIEQSAANTAGKPATKTGEPEIAP